MEEVSISEVGKEAVLAGTAGGVEARFFGLGLRFGSMMGAMRSADSRWGFDLPLDTHITSLTPSQWTSSWFAASRKVASSNQPEAEIEARFMLRSRSGDGLAISSIFTPKIGPLLS